MRLLAILFALGCGAKAQPSRAPVVGGNDLTLYRDWAIIRQRIEIDLQGPTSKSIEIAAGVRADQVIVLDRGGVTITSLHIPTQEELADPRLPTKITLDVDGQGRHTVVLGYLTDRLDWNVAYTMRANPARDRAEVRGALAIYNKSGVALKLASARVIDAELGKWRGKSAEQTAAMLIGGTPSSTPPAQPRELGPLSIGDGETRVELLAGVTRPMRSSLVYDAVGAGHDNPGPTPVTDDVEIDASTRVFETFEVTRDQAKTLGLPAGPVRLLEENHDGSLSVRGEARLFDSSARIAEVDTIAVGTANGVSGKRERREITVSEEGFVTEELVITLDNERAHPVRVLVREHLYRGQNWHVKFHSVPTVKEGPQQIAMRTLVPAKSQLKIMYVVVYTSGQ